MCVYLRVFFHIVSRLSFFLFCETLSSLYHRIFFPSVFRELFFFFFAPPLSCFIALFFSQCFAFLAKVLFFLIFFGFVFLEFFNFCISLFVFCSLFCRVSFVNLFFVKLFSVGF